MKHFVPILLFSISLVSCSVHDNDEEETIPIDELNQSIFKNEFFTGHYFSYLTSENGDSTKIFSTAYADIEGSKVQYFLRNCDATLKGDTLELFLNDSPFKRGLFELKILSTNEFSGCNFYETDLDSNNRTTFETIAQKIIQNKPTYKLNDSLKAIIDIKVFANFDLAESSYKDTLLVKAFVKAIVH